jgi:hypothetical protein
MTLRRANFDLSVRATWTRPNVGGSGGIYYGGLSYGGSVPGTGTPPKLDIIRPDTAWSIAIGYYGTRNPNFGRSGLHVPVQSYKRRSTCTAADLPPVQNPKISNNSAALLIR